MFDSLWQFYGFDWLSLFLGLSGTYLLGNQSKTGFLLGAASVATALVVSIMIGSVPFIFSNCLSLVLFVRGYLKWRTTHQLQTPAAAE